MSLKRHVIFSLLNYLDKNYYRYSWISDALGENSDPNMCVEKNRKKFPEMVQDTYLAVGVSYLHKNNK